MTTTREEWEAQVHQLRSLMAKAQTPDDARSVISRIAQMSRKYRIAHGIGMPPNPLQQAVEIDQSYRTRPHLEYLSDRIAKAVKDVENGQSRQLATSMPPRAGKSTLTSLYSPLWMLRMHPEWEIVMTSFDGGLTTAWARGIRQMIEDKPDLGVALKRDGGAGGRWETIEGGGMYSVGIGGALTGRGAKVMIIDDPVSDFVAAHSPRYRQNLWDWWLSVAQTRLEAPYLLLVTMCMTGDTPVLRPDGTETPLRDTRPGDEIATFTDEGEVTTSVVSNWVSQGVDDTFAVHLASGRTVQANARHPFWVVGEDGNGSWVRLESLRAGMKVRCLTEPTEGLSARQMTATSPQSARACACPITPEHAMQPGIDHPRRLMKDGERSDSKVGTESHLRTTTDSLPSRVNAVRSVEDTSAKSLSRPIGPKSSALTTATTPELCEVCFATIATSSLLAATRPTSFDGPLSTSVVSTDEIVSIIPAGREEVFDIEVVGTHRFIANGLDVSNTRWHQDDFVGRLLSPDHEGNPDEWERIVLPAIAEKDDPIGREVGDPLLSPLADEDELAALVRWNKTKENVGTYTWSGMYQQRPSPAKGAIFDAGWWRFWTLNPERVTEDGRAVLIDPNALGAGTWVDSWDLNFDSDGQSGDWVVGQRWVKMQANRYLVAQTRGRWNFTSSIKAMDRWGGVEPDDWDEEEMGEFDPFNPNVNPYGQHVHVRLVEKKANGAAAMTVLKNRISGLKAVNPRTSKELRARAVTPEIESGNVYLPHPQDPGNEWVGDLLSELRNFPHDAHDDQVDTLTQALNHLRGGGRTTITNPARSTTHSSRRDVAAAAKSDLARRRFTR